MHDSIYNQFDQIEIGEKLKVFLRALENDEPCNCKPSDCILLHLLEESYDGIILTDRKSKIFYASKGIERIIQGTGRKIALGKTSDELEKEGFILEQKKKVIGKYPIAVIHRFANGSEAFINSKPVKDKDGNFICNFANFRDMVDLNNLKKRLEEMIQLSHRYSEELAKLRGENMQVGDIITESVNMQQVVEEVIKVAPTDINILISGESGVGKEVIAKFIHRLSKRSEGPFIKINCGAIPENLLESELFGYDKGAFTGASKEGKIGLLELGNKGTILLDEIGDLPLNLQVKLLEAIQNREIYRVGGLKPIKLDVRIISATNRQLEDMVHKGTFREDLYYRLNVIKITVPPLRERKPDIINLSYYFLKNFNKKYSTHKTFSKEVVITLEQYDWPGNVRELENIIERATVISEDKEIGLDSLPPYLFENTDQNNSDEGIIPLQVAKERVEKEQIIKAFQKYRTLREVASVLKVDHSTIVRKMRKYKIRVDHSASATLDE